MSSSTIAEPAHARARTRRDPLENPNPQPPQAFSTAFPDGSATLESTSAEMVLLLDSVPVTGNTAAGDGGGIFIDPHQKGPGTTNVTLVFVNSEVSGNSAAGGGGGVALDAGVSVVLSGLNVSNNTADSGAVRKGPARRNLAADAPRSACAYRTATGGGKSRFA